MKIQQIIRLIRPYQWIKNIFVFLPLFFSGNLLHPVFYIPTFIAFFSFSFACSSIYCLNDIVDVERDRKHPKKRFRPIACGALSKFTGYVIMVFCCGISIVLSFLSGHRLLTVFVIVYVAMNILYTLKLKQYAIIDVFIIALGFVLRVVAGGIVDDIIVSHWLVMMTFLLTLFLAFAKRRDDVVIYQKTGVLMRKNIMRYDISFLNQVIGILGGITIVCYLIYTISPNESFNSKNIYLTSIFVIAGIIRYLQLTMVEKKSDDPTKVLVKDHFIQICIFGWLLFFLIIIYM